MSNKIKSTRYKGLTRISATFTKTELNDFNEVAQLEGISKALLLNFAVAQLLEAKGKKEMLDRVAQLIISGNRKGMNGGQNRKPIKKVIKKKKGVLVVVKGKKDEIGQIEMNLE